MTAPGDELHDDDPAPLSNNNNGASSVQVAVRVRPMLPHEAGNTQCIEVLKSSSSPSSVAELIRLGGEAGPKFTFDQIFPLTTSQHDVYRHRVAPLVASCLEGYNATILAYGQTGSGYVSIIVVVVLLMLMHRMECGDSNKIELNVYVYGNSHLFSSSPCIILLL